MAASSVMYESVPTYPDASRFWHIVDKFQVNVFYTAPTVIRSLAVWARVGRECAIFPAAHPGQRR
jgi:acyl-coenzyme A synthetase/AMP-(fatty) acid ligase